MKTLHIFRIFILLLSSISFSQNMQQGFAFLENGDFAKAESFFQNILKEYPTNKTARLCYARATGLNNNAAKALDLFVQLKEENPYDLEIKLNYAEALLWNKNYQEAKQYYTTLVSEYPDNFVANLGFANTLSNLKEYESALMYVNKALKLSEGNQGALTSRKYIKLGYANQMLAAKKYDEIEKMYNEILVDFPNDKETLLNKANLFLISKQIKKGNQVYDLLNPDNPNIALNGKSLLAHLDDKNKDALQIAIQSESIAKTITDESIINQTKERYVQALIWNKKYALAAKEIERLNEKHPNQNWVLALSATLAIYKSNFKKSIQDYTSILQNDEKSFDGNLGIANAYYASGETDKALEAVKKTLNIFENQQDATKFLKKINLELSPVIEEKLTYSFDNGNNNAFAILSKINIPASTQWAFFGSHQYRKTENSVTKASASSNDFLLGTTYQFHPKISYTLSAGATMVNSFSAQYNELLVQSYFKIKPFKLQDAEIGYTREMQNFNADLINKQIASNNIYLNYNISTNFNLGWFTQYFYTTQSDSNSRNLLFTSLYYTFSQKPILKSGLNYQYIAFKNQVPIDYFSPKRFAAVEIFTDLLADENSVEAKKCFYSLNAATGFQFIEDNEKQWTYRIQMKFGYKFSDTFLLNIFALKSNISSTTASGFTYNELGLRLKWILTK